MFKIKQYKNKVSFQFEANIRNKRQQHILKKLIEDEPSEALRYAQSFRGGKKDCMFIPGARDIRLTLKDSSRDDLARKGNGHILSLYHSLFDALDSHRPSNAGRGDWIGVEIECFIPADHARDVFGPEGIRTRPFIEPCECGDDECDGEGSHEPNIYSDRFRQNLAEYLKSKKIKRCSVKHDGSIEPDSEHIAVELTLVFNRHDRESLKNLCKELNTLEAKVNRSCGMHVHLDQRDLVNASTGVVSTSKVKARAANLGQCLPYLAKIVPKSRIGNSYCSLSVSGIRGDRYTAVNLTAFQKYQTIEVRLHSATTDFNKINNWIDLLLIISRGPKVEMPVASIDDLCMEFNIPERLIEYLEKREAMFARSHIEEPQTENQTGPVLFQTVQEIQYAFNQLASEVAEQSQQIYGVSPARPNPGFWGVSVINDEAEPQIGTPIARRTGTDDVPF